MEGDVEKAGREIEMHIQNGGSIEEILKIINEAIKESGFFQSLSKKKTNHQIKKTT